MAAPDFAALAARLGVSVDQVLELVSLGPDLRDLAGATAAARVIFSAADLDRSRAHRALPETDAEWAWAERYGERWSD